MSDSGLAAERTALARRRTTIPFLVVALLGVRAALDGPVAGLLVTVLAGAGAYAALRQSPTRVTVLVLTLAAAALAVPVPST